ncbi:peptidase family M28 [Diaporthe sp. PMI_573]|nr:peptidase family M28 [Diaporthaceae sp. PMI_573]
MRSSLPAQLTLLLLACSEQVVASLHDGSEQHVLAPEENINEPDPFSAYGWPDHVAEDTILAALAANPDPVDALLSLRPGLAGHLATSRLIHVLDEANPRWLTEGDKMRLRRDKKKFMDITDHQELYADGVGAWSGKANLPKLTHQSLVKPLFSKVSTSRMHDVLKHLSSYYNRYFGGETGEESSQWLHDHIAEIITKSPFHTHISLEFFTHPFPQSSIIARFEPKVRDHSKPLTIIGAHQDSANYLFPLLPAPGADDDGSGTVSILEAFRILATSGFIPKEGPVEFHWYAAEEGGLLGSQAIAAYKKKEGATIGAMMEFDMTAFIGRNATESIGFIKTDADGPLTKWAVDLSTEYIKSIPTSVYELMPGAGSDYMSFSKVGFPATFASEGNPVAGGFPGEFDPYVHTANDTIYVDDETGHFSFDHMARFTELAMAFAVEQAGWDNSWR